MYYWVAIVFLFLLLVVSLYYNYKFGTLIIRIQDTLEDSLDVLDERYASMSRVLKIPIFYDSKEVRQVVNDISASRDAILDIAKQLTVVDEADEDTIEREDKEIA
jgi:hypothetical protein